MSKINQHIGSRIRSFRKAQNLTLQQLADMIHKSRASLSKYENGEITLDVETLYEISQALGVEMNRLTDFQDSKPAPLPIQPTSMNRSPFYQAEQLYFYFYDGRYNRLKDGIINIHKRDDDNGNHEATLTISAVTPTGRSSDIYYSGKVVYSDMLIDLAHKWLLKFRKNIHFVKEFSEKYENAVYFLNILT